MAAQRLSKLQKWILTTCYKVTVQLDNETLVPIDGKYSSMDLCNYCRESGYRKKREGQKDEFDGKGNIKIIKNIDGHITNECSSHRNYACNAYCFEKEDILLTYFKLNISSRYSYTRSTHFTDCLEYRKAHVTLSRSLKTLLNNEYIGLYGGGYYSTIIKLTDKGATKAAELLGLEYIEIPAQTDEENELREKEHEVYMRSLELQAKAFS